MKLTFDQWMAAVNAATEKAFGAGALRQARDGW